MTAADGTPVISLAGITRVYGEGEALVRALRGVDLDIGRGEFVAIMGPSGSGKSTAMNIIGALDTPSEGSYRFLGADVGGFDRNQRALLRRDYLGFVFQGFNLLARTSALDNVELPLIYKGVSRAERREKAINTLQRVGLGHRLDKQPSQLSGGEQQRVAIARAIASEPEVLLADEPTGNLDTANGEQVMDILTALNAGGATIVMVTHSPSHADMAKRRIDMLDGRIVASAMRAI